MCKHRIIGNLAERAVSVSDQIRIVPTINCKSARYSMGGTTPFYTEISLREQSGANSPQHPVDDVVVLVHSEGNDYHRQVPARDAGIRYVPPCDQ